MDSIAKAKHLRAGFSVIEALAAIALLAVALAPLYSMLQQISDATARTRNFVEAREIRSTVISLVDTGLDIPEEVQGWSVLVTKDQSSSPEAVDGYLGGQYFMLSLDNYNISIQKNGFIMEAQYQKISLDPIYNTEDEAIFSNM
ncbi:hypothetical protein [Maricaulis sp.]|uniref:hypothetical protein n=1 Tax=Maricaulis sp. TaxID=1486257 RepID=UPI0026021E14|nr:hypothetical protein [Maricaulis sp.]